MLTNFQHEITFVEFVGKKLNQNSKMLSNISFLECQFFTMTSKNVISGWEFASTENICQVCTLIFYYGFAFTIHQGAYELRRIHQHAIVRAKLLCYLYSMSVVFVHPRTLHHRCTHDKKLSKIFWFFFKFCGCDYDQMI